jgi:Lon protease-like protein
MNMPIFPLPIYLLPEGLTRLRIFEQRYINMIKNVEQTNGFVISYFQADSAQHISQWGSWVEIVNFELDDGGILVIDVRCKALVSIGAAQHNADNLLFADVSPKEHWAEQSHSIDCEELTKQLGLLFVKNKVLAQIYQHQFTDRAEWVCARWLELLPVPFDDKNLFIDENSYEQAIDFLSQIINQENYL